MIKKIRSIGLCLSTSLFLSSTVFAATINFPIGQTKGNFSCVAEDSSALISIDAHGIKANGFCNGSQYVTREGHIDKLPASILKTYYFQIEKDIQKSGSVEVLASKDDVVCTNGKGAKLAPYGNGSYC